MLPNRQASAPNIAAVTRPAPLLEQTSSTHLLEIPISASAVAQAISPNGNAGVDGMISVLAHELEETNTDPNPTSGWLDNTGAENADKCAWTYGQLLTLAPYGFYYNMTLPTKSQPTRNYLVQRNLAANSLCYIDYITKAQ